MEELINLEISIRLIIQKMRRITDFIIEKRNFILIFFIILMSICFGLSNKVIINRDINKYLPSTSSTKKGLDIMEKEFANYNLSYLNIMFENLTPTDKETIYQNLQTLPNIESVDYNNTEDYNKDNYTLYRLTFNCSKDSKEAQKIYETIYQTYENYTITTSGDIHDENKIILPTWIVGLAIFCALIILIVMCDSYIEPFLFFLVIGIAIVLNKGTNIFFPTVSSITNSITTILQLALSMDYSIMLMNRYRQEKKNEKNNIKAMKTALYASFKSISSSSVTTIVGLLALVFMSFTIGKDLGLVLAKGVLFSLLTIFTCLPGLILLFDKLITKTSKKSPKFNLTKLGNLMFKIKPASLIIFLIIFLISYFLKGNLTILYTDTSEDLINQIFPPTNQLVLIYPNNKEQTIASYCNKIKENPYITDNLCYSTTINEPLTYTQLPQKLAELNSPTSIDDYLLKLIYYNYYNQDNQTKLTFDEFINFIKKDVYNNSNLSDQITPEIKNNIEKLSNFTNKNNLNIKHNSNEISTLFSIDTSIIQDLLIYYNSLSTNTNLTLPEFITFVNNYLLTSPYASKISKEALTNLTTLSKFTNSKTLTTPLLPNQMATLFNIELNSTNSLYQYYTILNNQLPTLTINEFTTFLLDKVVSNDQYKNLFNDEQLTKIKQLQTYSNPQTINTKLSSKDMAQLLNLDLDTINNIYLLHYLTKTSERTLTIKEFITVVTNIKTTTHYLDNFDTFLLTTLQNNTTLLENPTKYTAQQLSDLLKIDYQQINTIYLLSEYITNSASYVLSPIEIITFLNQNLTNPQLKSSLNSETITNIQTLTTIFNSALNNTKYNYQDLSKLISLNPDTTKNIYTLHLLNTTQTKITPQQFVTFILNHQNDASLKNNLSSSTLNNLNTINQVITSVLANQKYSANSLSKLLNINTDTAQLLYSLYDINYKKKTITLTYSEFINFLLNKIIPNPVYNQNFDNEKIVKIQTLSGIINNTLNNTLYTKDEIFAIISKLSNDVEKNLIDVLYIYYGSENKYLDSWQLTIEQFVNYLNDTILPDTRFKDFIKEETKNEIIEAKTTITNAKNKLVGTNYSRALLNTTYNQEDNEVFAFIDDTKQQLNDPDIYIVGNSSMAHELTKTFPDELNFITILTIIFIFVVVLITFKSLLIPLILVLIIQTSVYLTMSILSFEGGSVYFIALIIVQSILMGATIDYAILYTSYYLESRKTMNIKESLINSYNKSINTIFTSASILTIVTLIVGYFSSAITSKICTTISQGTICSTVIILGILPAIIAFCDKWLVKNKKKSSAR